jgi:hypothetical protein
MATTRRRLQPPYNQKVAKTTYHCPIQLLCRISRMMEPLSHYHCEINCCKPVPINMHQTTYTNNINHASTIHQSVPQPEINCTINNCINHAPTCTKQHVINIYHKQLHQPCSNLYQTTCNQPVPNNLSHQSYQPN